MYIDKIGILLIVICILHEVTSQSCLPGWMRRPGDPNCYLFTTSQKARSWADAQESCSGMKGSLLKINDNGIKRWIQNEISRRVRMTPNTNSWWVGSRKTFGASTWMWTDGTGINNGLRLWFNGQPTTLIVPGCAQITKNSVGTALSVIGCGTERPYICQRPNDAPSYCDNDNGWESHNGNCYKFFDYRRQWDDANMDCENHGSFLARITTTSQQKTVYDLAQDNNRDSWIGLRSVYVIMNQQRGNIQWQWANGSGVAVTHWASQEPNVVRGQENNTCVIIHPGTGNGASWAARGCAEEKQYICQKPEGACAPGWKPFGTMCYQFNPRFQLSYTNAATYCRNQGASLIEIISPDIQTFVNSYLSELRESGLSSFWIGLISAGNSQPYKWNGVRYAQYTNWINNVNPTRYQRCAYIATSNGLGKWYNIYCTSVRSFVCQIPSTVAVLPVTTPLPRYACKSGWVSHNYRSDDDHCYKFNTTLVNWQDAQTACQKAGQGGQLAIITNVGLQGYLNRYLRGTMWIGLTDTGTEGTFTWTDGSPATYTNWYGSDVTQTNSDSKDCVAELYDQGRRGTWAPRPCSEVNGFICSMPALNAPPATTGAMTTPRPWSVNCGPFWEENPSLGFCYQFRDDQKTWNDAEAYCRQIGGHLISITSSGEQNYVTGRIQTMSSIGLWIGANDKTIESGWRWSDNSAFTFINWSPGEPNNDQNREDCVNIYTKLSSWNDFNCNTKNGFICKKRSQAPTTTSVPPNTTPVPAGMFRGCPSGWLSYNSMCYLIRKDFQSWTGAQTNCRQNGGDLTSIANLAEQDYLYSQTRTVAGALWIGLNARRQDRSYQWSDASKAMYTHWGRGEPNNRVGGNENCVIFNLQGQGLWSDVTCNLPSVVGYICKKNPTTMSATTQQNFKVGCPTNGIGYNDKCYTFHTSRMAFAAAEKYCVQQGGHLASIPDRFVQSFVASELYGRHGEYWIGIQTSGTGYYYHYWTNKLRISYTNWDQYHTGEGSYPSCRELGSCGAMRSNRPIGLWHSASCSDNKQFICETKRVGFTTLAPGQRTTFSNRCPYYFSEYNGFCYRLMSVSSSRKKTWPEARDDCRYMGGDLVSIHNSSEALKLKQFVFRYNRNSYWIGLNRLDKLKGYTWSDGSAFTYNRWGANQPDNHNGQENCVEWDMVSNSWRDAICAVGKSYACQVKKGTVPVVTTRHPVVTVKPPITCGTRATRNYWRYYKGACYYFNYRAATWYQARSYCRNTVGGELASIHSLADSTFFITTLSKLSGTNYWIGLNELDLRGYKWSDNTPVNYRNWDVNEPNDAFGGQKCVQISSTNGYWGDDNCGQMYSYICKQLNNTKGGMVTPKPTQPMPGNCHQGWWTFGNKCYMVKDGPADIMTYSNAQAVCRRNGKNFNLVSIANADEQAFVFSMLMGKTKNYWIGLDQLQMLRRFVWTDNAPVSFTNWDYGEPNGSNYYAARQERCVEIRTTGKSAGSWADRKCLTRLGYICQGYKQPNLPIQRPTSLPSWCNKPGYSKYGQSCYKLVIAKKTWNDASKFCQNDGGHLVSIGDPFEQAYLRTKLWGQNINVWTGMTDIKLKGVYRWSDGWPVLYTNWAAGEPSRQDEEGCVALVDKATWNDTMCSNKYGSMCEISHGTAPPHTSMAPGFCKNSTWTMHGKYCFYTNPRTYASWPEAQFYCTRMGMRLGTIHQADDQTFLLSYIAGLKHRTSYNFWIGMINGKSGGFEWFDQTVVSYTNWAPKEPSNGKFRNAEECVQMHPTTGKWSDTYCTTRRPYICMADMVFPTQSGTGATPIPGQPTAQPQSGQSTNTPFKQRATDPTPGNGGGMSAGGVAGLIIGLLLVLGLAALGLIYARRRGLINFGAITMPPIGGGIDNANYNKNDDMVGIN